MLSSLVFMLIYLLVPIHHTNLLYILCVCMGFGNGYWTLFITVAAELFGTNLRATVATTVPNFVRGTVILLTSFFVLMRGSFGMINSALIVGILTYALALFAFIYLEETFTKDINFTESD